MAAGPHGLCFPHPLSPVPHLTLFLLACGYAHREAFVHVVPSSWKACHQPLVCPSLTQVISPQSGHLWSSQSLHHFSLPVVIYLCSPYHSLTLRNYHFCVCFWYVTQRLRSSEILSCFSNAVFSLLKQSVLGFQEAFKYLLKSLMEICAVIEQSLRYIVI